MVLVQKSEVSFDSWHLKVMPQSKVTPMVHECWWHGGTSPVWLKIGVGRTLFSQCRQYCWELPCKCFLGAFCKNGSRGHTWKSHCMSSFIFMRSQQKVTVLMYLFHWQCIIKNSLCLVLFQAFDNITRCLYQQLGECEMKFSCGFNLNIPDYY